MSPTAHEAPTARRPARGPAALLAVAACLSCPAPAAAHSTEGAFVLLLPTELYTTAGAAVVALTILLVLAMPPGFAARLMRPVPLGKAPRTERLERAGQALALVLLVLLLAAGALGPRDPVANPLVLVVWTAAWIAMPVIQVLAGDVWRLVNPFAALARLVTAAAGGPLMRLPDAVGVWPSGLLLILFGLFELADIAPSDPARLALAVFLYLGFTATMMALFGGREWLERGEFLTVLFTTFAHLAPLRTCPETGRIALGLPGWAVVARGDWRAGHGALVLAMLAIGSFDGLSETFLWLGWQGVNPLEFPGRSAVQGANAAGVLGAVCLLWALFLAVARLGARLAGAEPSRQAIRRLALSFLPIAAGYHLAHFLVGFLIDVQYLPRALADPFGLGWAGAGHGTASAGFLSSPGTVWLIYLAQVAAVVASHVVGVLLAHVAWAGMAAGRGRLARAEAPLAAFMVAYTVFGLWLLATPRVA